MALCHANLVMGPSCGCIATESFVFTNDLRCNGSPAITVTGINVTVNLTGFKLTSGNAADGTGLGNTGIFFDLDTNTSGGTIQNGTIEDFDVGISVANGQTGEFIATDMLFQNQFEHAVSFDTAGATLTVAQSTFDSLKENNEFPTNIAPYIIATEPQSVTLTSNRFVLGPHSGAEISDAAGKIEVVENVFDYVMGVDGNPEDVAVYGISLDGVVDDSTVTGTIQGNCFHSNIPLNPVNSVGVMLGELNAITNMTGNTFTGLEVGVDLRGNSIGDKFEHNCLAKNTVGIGYGFADSNTNIGNLDGNIFLDNEMGDIVVQTSQGDDFIIVSGSDQASNSVTNISSKGGKKGKALNINKGTKKSKGIYLSNKSSKVKKAAPCACSVMSAGAGNRAIASSATSKSGKKTSKVASTAVRRDL